MFSRKFDFLFTAANRHGYSFSNDFVICFVLDRLRGDETAPHDKLDG